MIPESKESKHDFQDLCSSFQRRTGSISKVSMMLLSWKLPSVQSLPNFNQYWPCKTQSSFSSWLWWLVLHTANSFLGIQTYKWRNYKLFCTISWQQSLFIPHLCLLQACQCQGLHGLSCRRSTSRHQHHAMLNYIKGQSKERHKYRTKNQQTRPSAW